MYSTDIVQWNTKIYYSTIFSIKLRKLVLCVHVTQKFVKLCILIQEHLKAFSSKPDVSIVSYTVDLNSCYKKNIYILSDFIGGTQYQNNNRQQG